MSCPDGICMEPGKRRRALIMLGLMMLVFIMLSAFSFVSSRNQVTPETVSYASFQATDGKRVFQAFNCMDCHTIVGNGAYLAPDLTKEYRNAGPAWLAAFLPSAGTWPTEMAVKMQLMNPQVAAEAGVDSIGAYYDKYPGARERVERRGGHTTYMPNLPFDAQQVGQLIAFLKYTSLMNNEGWPPEVKTGDLARRLRLAHGTPAVAAASNGAAAEAAAPANPAVHGQDIARQLGCIACHSSDGQKLIGPTWKGLYGSQVALSDGTTVTADDAYLNESILKPNAQIVAGYPPGVMPEGYDKLLSPDDVSAIVAYIRTLEKP